MLSIKDFTDKELLEHIAVNQELLESSELGSGDYNSAASELMAARQEMERREKQIDSRRDLLCDLMMEQKETM